MSIDPARFDPNLVSGSALSRVSMIPDCEAGIRLLDVLARVAAGTVDVELPLTRAGKIAASETVL